MKVIVLFLFHHLGGGEIIRQCYKPVSRKIKVFAPCFGARIDFSLLDLLLGKWFEKYFDH